MSTPPTDPELARLWERYIALGHAVQSGIALWMSIDGKETTPKHLRVGVNVAHVDHSALARLLMAKGVITELEYVTALIEGMEAEVRSYQEKIAAHYGREPESIRLA